MGESMDTKRQTIRKYVKERNEVLRSLDQSKFDDLCKRWLIPTPREGWLPDSRMILMHKARLQIEEFTEEEKAISRKWLEEHHCSLDTR
jgi:hypothetical protein